MNKTKIEDVGRIYSKLSPIIAAQTVGDDLTATSVALVLIALLLQKQAPWHNGEISRKAAFMELISKLYDQTDVDPSQRKTDEGEVHGSV